MKLLVAIYFTSILVNEFELLRSLAWWSVGFARLRASVENVDTLGWLFTTFWFRTRETTVTCCDSAESSLTPLQFTRTALLNALNRVHGVASSLWTVALNLTWHLDHD